ncbi:hypothetical protein RvY_14844 [Ramazzottius varieornatus]|uniref:Uncharacterized protein n=1 Tax=Ramazzottius varieornatus TaxID=947166 RepID=A0A1D1VST1_RAMVA|nr:hypothetical protein RvY_14844 [Ramazzottius varieornatus]
MEVCQCEQNKAAVLEETGYGTCIQSRLTAFATHIRPMLVVTVPGAMSGVDWTICCCAMFNTMYCANPRSRMQTA